MSEILTEHLYYALGWASFGFVHSVLAAESVKGRLRLGRWHRLAYNGFAAVHLGAIWWLGRSLLGDSPPLGLAPELRWAGDALTLTGLIVIGVALLGYDRGRFLGTTQLRQPDAAEDEELRIDGLHRYVRHPLYSGLFLVLWGHAQSEFALTTAIWASVYLLIGTYFEERRLLDRYGEAYRSYRAVTPAYIPWRGRASGG